MTCKEKLAIEYPGLVDDDFMGGCYGCPDDYGYLDVPDYCNHLTWTYECCIKCWDREIPNSDE